jgi:hypothetical protein
MHEADQGLHVIETSLPADGGPIYSRLRIAPGSPHEAGCRALIERAASIARPRAAWRDCRIDDRDGGAVIVGGTRLEGPLLTENLCDSGHAFPFIATAGADIERWASGFDDMLERYWADEIAGLALEYAVAALMEKLLSGADGKKISMLNPGSLPGWTIEGQRALFTIMEREARTLGVSLGENMMMRPLKSISGIMYFSESEFVNCSRCTRVDCHTRRAPCRP